MPCKQLLSEDCQCRCGAMVSEQALQRAGWEIKREACSWQLQWGQSTFWPSFKLTSRTSRA